VPYARPQFRPWELKVLDIGVMKLMECSMMSSNELENDEVVALAYNKIQVLIYGQLP